MKTKILILVMIIGIIVASCGNTNKAKVITAKEDGKQYTVKGNPHIADFGNGIYYYKLNESDDFGLAISALMTLHKNLKISVLTPDFTQGGGVYGYWIITEPIIRPCDTIKK